MTETVDDGFPAVIALTAGPDPGSFVGPESPERSGATYGGQLMAQAVSAAYRTVDDDRRIHSLHALFLRAGAVDETTLWQVEQIRDGRSFSARSVSGHQGGKEIFRVMTSFHVPEPGLDHQPTAVFDQGSLPDPDEVTTTYIDFCNAHPDTADADWHGEDRPMDIRYIDHPDPAGGPVDEGPQLMWCRVTGGLPDDHVTHDAALAYLADSTLIDHVTLPHGRRWHDGALTGVSLDHAMWFHRPARADQWLLYEQAVESTGGARGLAAGRFWTRDGTLVATCGQEGLMRFADLA